MSHFKITVTELTEEESDRVIELLVKEGFWYEVEEAWD